jgi:hypothetical protein
VAGEVALDRGSVRKAAVRIVNETDERAVIAMTAVLGFVHDQLLHQLALA